MGHSLFSAVILREIFRKNTDDSFRRFIFDKFRINLLSVPREDISIGDVYITDESGES